jgi:thiol-disulfide isomerase/thioredoxin
VPVLSPKRKRRSISPFVAVLLGIVAVGVVATVLTRSGQEAPEVSDVTADVTVRGDPLPPFQGGDDPAVGEEAPGLTGTDLDGRRLRIVDEGRPKAIIFLAHWCPHCQREVEDLVEWLDDHELGAGADIYSVSTLVDATRGNFPPDAWLEGAGWPFPVIADSEASAAANAFGLTGTPLWVFIDASGRVAERISGELGPETFAQKIEDLLADG